MIDIVKIIRPVLNRLSQMDCESTGGKSSEQLIFPLKKQANGELIDRVSEQELRFLFVEEFKKEYPELFYSIETPTVEKYNFTANTDKKHSALHDMCIFNRDGSGKYKRLLSVEFKHKNTTPKNIEKDICKLINEEQDGVFIQLFNNSNSNTLCSYFKKLEDSFKKHHCQYKRGEGKSVQIIILSLKQKILIHRTLNSFDMKNLETIFLVNKRNGDMSEFSGDCWLKEQL